MRTRVLDINVLMVIAVAGAAALGDWLEAATVVWLFGVAQWLEVRSIDRARNAHSLADAPGARPWQSSGGMDARTRCRSPTFASATS